MGTVRGATLPCPLTAFHLLSRFKRKYKVKLVEKRAYREIQ